MPRDLLMPPKPILPENPEAGLRNNHGRDTHFAVDMPSGLCEALNSTPAGPLSQDMLSLGGFSFSGVRL